MSTWHGEPYPGFWAQVSRETEEARKAQQDTFISAIARIDPYHQAQRKEKETMLERLKRFGRLGGEQHTASVDEMVELSMFARHLVSEYQSHQIPVPKWLREAMVYLERKIRDRYQVELENDLRKAERELEELRSQEEKRAAKEKEVEVLRKALGVKP